MTKDDILATVQQLFRKHFKDEQLLLTFPTAQNDISDWDSLNHAMLIEQIETKYDIKFDLMDMISMENVGDICDKILAKKTS